MKIKKFLGLILFAFIGVLALASCNSKGSFETQYYGGQTFNGDLYVSHYNDYYLFSDSKIYTVGLIENISGEKEFYISELNIVNLEKIDNNTWVYQKYIGASKTYFIFINDGQELLQISSGDYVSVYVKTDHIEEE